MNVPSLCSPPPDTQRRPTGVATLDAALGGGVAEARLHEVYASDPDDTAAAAGFAALVAAGLSPTQGRDKPLVWLHEQRMMQACGMMQVRGLLDLAGLLVQSTLFVQAADNKALLQAGLDAVRCDGLGAVIIQAQGRLPELDLTASRRLAMAARQSGVTLLLLRIAAEPVASAAETRWAAASAPSRAMPANAPGLPTFDITLLRQRSGPSGMDWRLEWDRDRRIFNNAEVSGAVVSVPVRRPAADTGTGTLHRVA